MSVLTAVLLGLVQGVAEFLPISSSGHLAIADLDTTPGDLMGWDQEDSYNVSIDNIYKIDKIKLPLLGKVACGEPIYADEDRESYVMVGTDIKADFCLTEVMRTAPAP